MFRTTPALIISILLAASLALGTVTSLEASTPQASPSASLATQATVNEDIAHTNTQAHATGPGDDQASLKVERDLPTHETEDPNLTLKSSASAQASTEELPTVEAPQPVDDVTQTFPTLEATLTIDLDELAPRVDLTVVGEDGALDEPNTTMGAHQNVAFTGDDPSPPSDGLFTHPTMLALTSIAMLTTAGAVHANGGIPWLRRLIIGSPITPLFSRINRTEALDHDTRDEIYTLLNQNPGLSIQEIAGRLDLPRSTARHHIRILETKALIESTNTGRCQIHYITGHRKEAIHRHILKNKTRARIAQTIQQEPRTLTEIAEALDANAATVYFHLQKLCQVGLAKRKDDGRVRYERPPDS